MRVRKISVGMRGIWVEIRKMWEISRVAMQRIKVENLSIAVEITWNSIEMKN